MSVILPYDMAHWVVCNNSTRKKESPVWRPLFVSHTFLGSNYSLLKMCSIRFSGTTQIAATST